MREAMDYNELIALWTKAFNWLYEKDVALFETDVQERAIAGRLAMYPISFSPRSKRYFLFSFLHGAKYQVQSTPPHF